MDAWGLAEGAFRLSLDVHLPPSLGVVANWLSEGMGHRPDWKERCSAPPAVRKYLYHLQQLRERDAYLLLAHFYTQEVGMLAGADPLCMTT